MRYVFLIVLALFTMGNKGCNGKQYGYNSGSYCPYYNYPYCRNVPDNYPCLCLSGPYGVTAEEEEAMARPETNGEDQTPADVQ